MKNILRSYRINQYIRANPVRLINEEGKQVGIVPFEEALRLAREAGTDLVEIAPNAKPSVCRIVDYKKFIYELSKRQRDTKKHTKQVELKEVRVGPFIGKHDLEVRLSQIKNFLTDGDRVKVNIKFTGRQMAHPEFGEQLARKIIEYLQESGIVEREPHFEGRQYITVFLPKKGS